MAGLKDIIHPNPFRRLTEGKAGLQRLAAADAAAVRERRKRLVWDKGIRVRNLNPNEWRRDAHGNLICFADYGNRNSDHGWEIDHITPRLLGGVTTSTTSVPAMGGQRQKGIIPPRLLAGPRE